MSIKVVLLFQQTTLQGSAPPGTFPSPAPSIGYGPRVHLGGWSESIYWDANSLGPLVNALTVGYGGKPALAVARAALLPYACSIIGARFYQGGAGKGQSLAFSFPGNSAYHNDIPQMAILVKAAPSSTAVSRRFTLRGIPDDFVVVGEFAPTAAYAAAIANYFQALSNFSFLAVDPASPQATIFSITAAGLVTCTNSPQPFIAGQLVTIQKAVDAVGNFVTFTGNVATTGPLPSQFTMTGWTAGACTKGKAIVKSKALFQINAANCAVSRVVIRKVGRPFEQYRGRRSKRRSVA